MAIRNTFFTPLVKKIIQPFVFKVLYHMINVTQLVTPVKCFYQRQMAYNKMVVYFLKFPPARG